MQQVTCLGFVVGAESATQHSQMKGHVMHVVQHNQAVFAHDKHELLSPSQQFYHVACHHVALCAMNCYYCVCVCTGCILLMFASLAVCSTVAQLTTTLRMRAVGPC